MLGSVIVIVIGDEDVGEEPDDVAHETARDATYDWPEGTCVMSDEVFVTGYTLTTVPLGSAPAGTVMAAVAPPDVTVMVVGEVEDVVCDVGVP